MEADELIALIEGAFPAHPIPDVTLRQRTLSDQGMAREISDEEWECAGRVDRDVPWTALSDNDLMECQDGIAHLWGQNSHTILARCFVSWCAIWMQAYGHPKGALSHRPCSAPPTIGHPPRQTTSTRAGGL
jgi:hypothetical protein